MLWFIIALIVGGLVVGALGRLLHPGKDPMSVPMTIGLGVVAMLAAGLLIRPLLGFGGGFITAVLFTIGQQLIGLYLGQSNLSTSFGAAASIMILLLWVYYSCQVLLLGAEFTRVYSEGTNARVS